MRTFLASTVLACAGFAQEAEQQPMMEAPAPARELARYDRLIGTWEGSGTVNMPMAEGVEWTSRTHTRRVLGGHFVRADTRIDIEGEMPGSIAFITFYGWDRERQRYVYYEVSNMGMLMEGEVLWPDAETMMTMSASTNQGEPKVERWITNLKDGTHEFVGEEAAGTGPWGVHVRGSSRKLEQEQRVDLSDMGAFYVQQGREMRAAQRMAGTYAFEGTYRMAADQEAVDVRGEEIARPLFDGTVLEFVSTGGDGEWEGWYALVHDHVLGHYQAVGLDSMGRSGVTDVWHSDGSWIFAASGLMLGQPVLNRMVLHTDEAGRMTGVVGHSLMGTAEPFESIKATYSHGGEVGTRPASAEVGGEQR